MISIDPAPDQGQMAAIVCALLSNQDGVEETRAATLTSAWKVAVHYPELEIEELRRMALGRRCV